MRILGVDYGEKRIGIAVSDPQKSVAHGIEVVERGGKPKSDFRKIAEIIKRYDGVEEIVVGLPKTLKGEIGTAAKEVLAFIDRLNEAVGVPVKTWDERFSTVAAERPLKEGNIARSKRKKLIDSSAAAFMLQGYLDHQRRASL